MNIDNKIDKNIIEFVLKLLNIPYESHKYFTDGVSSLSLIHISEPTRPY